MKVSLNLAQEYSNVDLLSIGTETILHKIGSQLGAVEEVIDWGSRYKDIVIANVISCEKHPDADKLYVCLIDDGGVTNNVKRNSDNLVQVVCGAPNVRAGLLVAWLPPGSTVPSSIDKDPFVLSARELRGVISNGMLASAHELGISDDHNGILEIEPGYYEPGTPLHSLYSLNDTVIDCENKMFTHRPDCFGILGVARELAGINNLAFESPEWYKAPLSSQSPVDSNLTLSSSNDITEKVPRFMLQVVENVTVKASSVQRQSDLARLGSKSINSIVDATNYYMHLTAQPTHAFDYDKVAKLCNGEVTVFPRMANDGETIQLLNGKTITLTTSDIVIATDMQAIALAGVMGGSETEVDETTKNIVIECATFDMYTIRRTSMRHGLFTDAVTRFNKGQSPMQNPVVLAKIVSEIADGSVSKVGPLYDSGFNGTKSCVEVSADFINQRLGGNIDVNEMKHLLTNVEFDVEISEDVLKVTPPFWRMDIEIPEDVVEEIGRLYSYDTLPTELPLRPLQPVSKNKSIELKHKIRKILASAGANEILTYSFVSSKLLETSGQDSNQAYSLSNALSPSLQHYRLTLTPSVLSKVNQNIRAGFDRIALFEIGNTHVKMHGLNEESVPEELGMISLVYAANDKKVPASDGSAYYCARAYLDYVARKLGRTFVYKKAAVSTSDYEVVKPFDLQRSALVSDLETGTSLGIIGEYTDTIVRNMKAPSYSAGFEISSSSLLKIVSQAASYSPLSKYPKVSQDITYQTALELEYSELYASFNDSLQSLSSEHGYVSTITPTGSYSKENTSLKNISFRIAIHHPNRTLTTDEVTKYIDNVVQSVESSLKVKRV